MTNHRIPDKFTLLCSICQNKLYELSNEKSMTFFTAIFKAFPFFFSHLSSLCHHCTDAFLRWQKSDLTYVANREKFKSLSAAELSEKIVINIERIVK